MSSLLPRLCKAAFFVLFALALVLLGYLLRGERVSTAPPSQQGPPCLRQAAPVFDWEVRRAFAEQPRPRTPVAAQQKAELPPVPMPSPFKSAAIVKPTTFHCADGTFSTAIRREGACSHHGGILAAPPAMAAPTSAAIICNDGSTSGARGRRGACSHHGGIR